MSCCKRCCKRIRKPRNYFLLFSFIFELVAILLIWGNQESICVQAREISAVVELFLLMIGEFLIPDLMFCIMIAVNSKNILRPLGFVYSIYATVMCVLGTVLLSLGLSFCGNPSQTSFLIAAILGGLAAVSHFGSIFEAGMGMPKTEKFAMKR